VLYHHLRNLQSSLYLLRTIFSPPQHSPTARSSFPSTPASYSPDTSHLLPIPPLSLSPITLSLHETMKIIITGGSGFIGTEVITQCLSNPAFSEVIALSRKPLSASLTKHEKLRTILMKDEDWLDLGEVVRQSEGVDACIWYVRGCCNLADLATSSFPYRALSSDTTPPRRRFPMPLPQSNTHPGVLAQKT